MIIKIYLSCKCGRGKEAEERKNDAKWAKKKQENSIEEEKNASVDGFKKIRVHKKQQQNNGI